VIGDLIGAPIVFAAGLTLEGERLYAEYVVEFVLAYALGIAFQYFPIRATRELSPLEAMRDAAGHGARLRDGLSGELAAREMGCESGDVASERGTTSSWRSYILLSDLLDARRYRFLGGLP